MGCEIRRYDGWGDPSALGNCTFLMVINRRRAVRSMPGEYSDVAGVVIDDYEEVIARCSKLSRECNLPLSVNEVR